MSYGGAGGLYLVGGVVLLVGFACAASGPGVLSQRCTTRALGQGSDAVLMGRLIPRPHTCLAAPLM